MYKINFLILTIILGITTTGMNSFATDIPEIYKTFQLRCTHCHGDKGAGDGPTSIILSPKPTNFRLKDYSGNNFDNMLEMTIKKGRNSMPSFESILSQDEINNLVFLIKTLTIKP